MPQIVAKLDDVIKEYPPGTRALQSINLEIHRGKITCLTGANGSGKTTLLKLLAGKLSPTSGKVELDGLNPSKQKNKLHQLIGYSPQDTALDPEMTGGETLEFFAVLHKISPKEVKARTHSLAQQFEIEEIMARRVETYSGGQRQRLHLATGLVHKPQILLLDEPTSALDPHGKKTVWKYLRHFCSSEKTVVVICHELQDVEQFCDTVIILDEGKIAAHDNPKTLVVKTNLCQLEITFKQGKGITCNDMEEIRSLAGVKRAETRNEKITLSAENDEATEKRVLGFLREKKLTILEIRKHAPDLSTVFFSLTGKGISPIPGHKKAGAKRKK